MGSALMSPLVYSGDYSLGKYDSGNAWDAPVPGFVGPDGDGFMPVIDEWGEVIGENPNVVNPVFIGWGYRYDENGIEYPGTAYEPIWDSLFLPFPVTGDDHYPWGHDYMAEGPLLPYINDVCSMGGYAPEDDVSAIEPGYMTLYFRKPVRDVPGADFVVYENGIFVQSPLGEDGGEPGEGVGGVFAELAYIEVSSDGVHFARFPSVSLTETGYGPNGSLDPTNVYNLAGKHVNNERECWGTPFDLSSLREEDLVSVDGDGIIHRVDINNIRYVKVVDIPGNGSRLDSLGNPIYDPFPTGIYESGGFDLDAIAVVGQDRGFSDWDAGRNLALMDDDDGDGVPNLLEYAFDMNPTVKDGAKLPRMEVVDGRAQVRFRRDVRNSDITYILEATDSLTTPDWHEVARAEAFSDPVVSEPELEAETSTVSRHTQANLDVWQEVCFTDLALNATRFYRLRVDTVN